LQTSTTALDRFSLSRAHGLFAASHQEAAVFVYLMFRQIVSLYKNKFLSLLQIELLADSDSWQIWGKNETYILYFLSPPPPVQKCFLLFIKM